ncbi:hypothetical protein BCV70DRAFT_218632 [Testicularia cyperi]|uniref:Uncharacterized protein n=1 Tax=Testicularia cyperi TaxID=1882483 RepID=A0A317XK21_9BASI|nr:hypothetical protein BCV70DRAFT_218632 [Testicularia cyperi]
MEAPKVIGQATKEANKALKLTANDFLGSGVKRKSVAGTYAGLGAVGLGAGAIGYNAVNMEAKQAEQQAKRIKNEVANKHFCAKERERAAKAAIDKRALTDEGLAAVEDYSKFIATTEAVVGSALAVKTANMNYQASRADLQAMRC